MKKQIRYSPELRERAVRLVHEHEGIMNHSELLWSQLHRR